MNRFHALGAMSTLPSTGQIVVIITPVVALLLTILTILVRASNKMAVNNNILNSVVAKVDEHDDAISRQGRQISTIAGAFGQFTGRQIQINDI